MNEIDAVVLDLDGVITQTASVHARAWKKMFDEYGAQRSAQGKNTFAPFDPDHDYREHVDGKSRQDGVRDFLRSRAVILREGSPSDAPGIDTLHGLGNLKNRIFLEMLREEKPQVFEDAVRAIRVWKFEGKRIAVASSSKNCLQILKSAGLLSLFDVRVDGNVLEELHLRGKPAPDLLLTACRRLAVEPRRAMLIEDALAGVQAGKNAGFRYVVGVARSGGDEALREAGADLVVRGLDELFEKTLRKAAN